MANASHSPRPLNQHHAQVLARYAKAIGAAARRDWGEDVARSRIDEITTLGRRVSQFAAEGKGQFAESDVTLVAEIGDQLVSNATGALANANLSSEAKRDATYRLGLGNELLEVRDALRKQLGN